MKKKISIYIALIGILTISIFILSGCQNTKQPVNNVENTTNTKGTSLRNQIMGVTQNYITDNTVTETTNIEDLEKYNKEEDSNFKTYKDSEGVSFMYPKNWMSLGKDDSPAFMSTDGKGATVNLTKDKISEETTVVTDFDTYISFQKLYLMQQMTMLSDIQEKQINLNGKRAYILNYVTESEENEITMQLNVTQVAFVDEDNNVYILTMAVLDKYHNDIKPTFDKITKSFIKE